MDNVMVVALLCYCLLITTGTDGEDAGNVKIENCNKGVIDIRQNANNTILCTGFNERDTIMWTFKGNGSVIPQVATCISSVCTVHDPSHFAVERSQSESKLYYQQYDTEVDKSAIVTCHSQFEQSNRSMECHVNVINRAMLSSCRLEEDRANKTVSGICRFENAYSFRRLFTCTWYQDTFGESTSFPGNIKYDNVSIGPSGSCTFTTTLEPGTYAYSINFYPGPGNITVNVGKIDTSPKTPEENDLPLGAIVGGIVAVVAVIIIIVVVVVVVFIRRKRRQKPAGSVNGSGDVASKENNDFEEHVNPMYVTSEVPDDTHSTDHKPSAIALRNSSHSNNGHPAAPHSLEADMFTTVDGEARHAPSSAEDRSGGYEDIGFGSNGNKRVPQKDAIVDKSRAQKGPASSANTSASSPAHTAEGSDEYAVDKSSTPNKAAKNIASGLSDAATNNAGADVYAQVNKSAKKAKVAEPETEGAAYAQVQKAKPAAKPKTSAKPSSTNKDEAQRGAADDDEYHALSHTRGSPHTQDQADLESQYSHIGYN